MVSCKPRPLSDITEVTMGVSSVEAVICRCLIISVCSQNHCRVLNRLFVCRFCSGEEGWVWLLASRWQHCTTQTVHWSGNLKLCVFQACTQIKLVSRLLRCCLGTSDTTAVWTSSCRIRWAAATHTHTHAYMLGCPRRDVTLTASSSSSSAHYLYGLGEGNVPHQNRRRDSPHADSHSHRGAADSGQSKQPSWGWVRGRVGVNHGKFNTKQQTLWLYKFVVLVVI